MVPPRWAELRVNSMVQSLVPSAMPACQAVPKPVQEDTASGACRRSPSEVAVTVTDVVPRVAYTVTVWGVWPVAHTQVSSPTTVACASPSFGFLSIDGGGTSTAFHTARASTTGSTGG